MLEKFKKFEIQNLNSVYGKGVILTATTTDDEND